MISRFDILDCVDGSFWTVQDEMIKELENWGYEVILRNEEYLVIWAWDEDLEDEDPAEFILHLGHANSTMWVSEVEEVA